MMIKTIIFDLGGVYFSDGVKKLVDTLSQKYGLERIAIAKALEDPLASDYRMGKVSEDTFWDAMKKQWGISESSQSLALLWHTQYVPIDGMVHLVDKLKDAGFELLFLSDNIPQRVEYLEKKYNFTRHFSDGVYSHHIGARKPDIKMYEEVLKKTKSRPEECVFIDDKQKNLIPAQKIGMKTIHFISPDQLLEELQQLGIAIQ